MEEKATDGLTIHTNPWVVDRPVAFHKKPTHHRWVTKALCMVVVGLHGVAV